MMKALDAVAKGKMGVNKKNGLPNHLLLLIPNGKNLLKIKQMTNVKKWIYNIVKFQRVSVVLALGK